MATSAQTRSAGGAQVKEHDYAWEGKDKTGKTVRGEMRAGGETIVNVTLRRQGIMVTKVKKKVYRAGKKVTDKDITLFTRQLATMMKAGVSLLQSFDIVGKGHANPSVSKLVMDLRADIETGTSLNQAFRKFPLYFDPLFCNLVGAGRLAPKLVNTSLKAGTTQIMITAVTTNATARLDTGYISADLILALMASVFSL